MKTNIVGWIYIVASPLFIFVFLIMVLFKAQFLTGFISLGVGIFGLIWGSAIRHHKIWSWYMGMVVIPLVAFGNMFTLLYNFELFILLPLALNIFSFYAMVSEKELFFETN